MLSPGAFPWCLAPRYVWPRVTELGKELRGPPEEPTEEQLDVMRRLVRGVAAAETGRDGPRRAETGVVVDVISRCLVDQYGLSMTIQINIH